MKIFALICENGLGHYKRTIEILQTMQVEYPESSFTIACENWQIEQMSDWDVSVQFWSSGRVRHLNNLIAPGVKWCKNPKLYKEGFLTTWHQRLKDVAELKDADFVISDNLPQVLHYRHDAVLLGSFLWSDILEAAYPNDTEVQKFVEEENQLLSNHRPPMICLQDMVMPEVPQKTRAISMPWFCTKKKLLKSSQNELPKIGLLGGATDTINQRLLEIAKVLSGSGKFIVCLPKPLAMQLDHFKNIQTFNFDDKDFLQLDLIICRPGIGTLTDGVRYGVPLATIHEPCNIEMIHNARSVQDLNIGFNLGSDAGIDDMVESIIKFVYSEKLPEAKKNIAARPDQGVQETVNWIFKKYNY